jgi:hypothetical protein
MTMMKALSLASIAVLTGLPGGPAFAQEAIQFRLEPVRTNPMDCQKYDASLSRVHSVTLDGDKAIIKSAGGINDDMKQVAPKVYKTTFRLGSTTLHVTADAAATPRSLLVAEPNLGCKWNAVAS